MFKKMKEMFLVPFRVMRWWYVPLLMVYFAFGAMSFYAILLDFWVLVLPFATIWLCQPKIKIQIKSQ